MPLPIARQWHRDRGGSQLESFENTHRGHQGEGSYEYATALWELRIRALHRYDIEYRQRKPQVG
jgi:hypothetical protein